MKKETIVIADRTCYLYPPKDRIINSTDTSAQNGENGSVPKLLLLQAGDSHDVALLDREVELIRKELRERTVSDGNLEGREGVAVMPAVFFAAVEVKDWGQELSPWPVPPTFGEEPFGDGAPFFLQMILEQILPAVTERFGLPDDVPVILGGYSLAGLFALWAAYQTDRFAGVCGVSPSVWYPDWDRYTEEHRIRSGVVYLSLGTKEEKTRNPLMKIVGDRIRGYEELLRQQYGAEEDRVILEWNPGNHFIESERRTAKGFVWCCRHVVEQELGR